MLLFVLWPPLLQLSLTYFDVWLVTSDLIATGRKCQCRFATKGTSSIRTRDNVAHSRINHHQLLLGSWNIFILTGKELELVEEAKRYHLDIIGVSSTKRRGSGLEGIYCSFVVATDSAS